MGERKVGINVEGTLRDRLKNKKGTKTWDQYLEELEKIGDKMLKDSKSFG